MRIEEVEERVGKENMEEFGKWMRGQTMGIYDDGTWNYYDCDVESFALKLKTGKDRQENPLTWD
jgi:hypothetical protein